MLTTSSLAQSHSALCFAKFQSILKLLKQWRVKQDLCHVVYPECLDSVLLMLLAQLFIKQKPCLNNQAASAGTSPVCPAEFFIFNSVSFVMLKVLEELSHVELFRSVLIDNHRQET